MSTEQFSILEHVVPACHIREYAGSTVDQEDTLDLHVKQYTPRTPTESATADAITIIAAHGVALAKELYEPLWDELLLKSRSRGVNIRGIWIADFSSMGRSGVLNETKLSMDCSWMDHARDLLLLVNYFRSQMVRPLVGIGHSFGGTIIANLAYIHPRLFTTVILLDPVIQLTPPTMGFGTDPPGAINYTLWRDDIWPTRTAAYNAHRKLLKNWDPRCVHLMLQYGFRELPTLLHPTRPPSTSITDSDIKQQDTDTDDTPVTLTTTKQHDLLGQIRENFSSRDPDDRVSINRATHADMDPLAAFIPLYRPEPRSTFYRLPSLRPSCLWVLGGGTFLRLDEIREGIKVCGAGVGGSGGVGEGCVKEILLPKAGHLFPFENVSGAAEACATWLEDRIGAWRVMEREWQEKRQAMEKKGHLVLSEEWYKHVRPISGGKNKL